MSLNLDTHAAIQRLTVAGFPPEQAEAIVSTVARADSTTASKTDLAVAKSDLENAIARLDARITAVGVASKTDLAAVKSDLQNALARLDARITAVAADLENAVARLDARITAVAAASKADLESAIGRLEVRLLKWAITLGLAIAGLLFTAIRFFA